MAGYKGEGVTDPRCLTLHFSSPQHSPLLELHHLTRTTRLDRALGCEAAFQNQLLIFP